MVSNLFCFPLSQENIVIVIVALVIISLLLLTPILGIITSITVFLITLIAGNYYWKDVGLGSAWVQTILIIILIIYTLLYLALSIVRESALLKIQACCYVLPALLFIIRLASEEAISTAIYIGVLTLMGLIFVIPIAGGVLAVTFFVLILIEERPAFLPELFIVFFICSIIYSICIIRIKKLSLIQLACYSLPNVLIIAWLWEWYFSVFYFLFLGLVATMAILLQRFEIITKAHESLKKFIPERVQKKNINDDDTLQQEILKKKKFKRTLQTLTSVKNKLRPYLTINRSIGRYLVKIRYGLTLILGVLLYLVITEVFQSFISFSQINKSITDYPEMTPIIILLIILFISCPSFLFLFFEKLKKWVVS